MNWTIKIYLVLITSAIITLLLPSCIKEDPDTCRINVSFEYSYNMLSANALESQVDELMLYVFDENGVLVSKYNQQGEAISNSMTIEMDKLQTGRYQFVAWAKGTGLPKENADFTIPNLTTGESQIQDLKYFLSRSAGMRKDGLNHFFVGTEEAYVENSPGVQHIKVQLKKVTKKIRVVIMPYVASSTLDVNSYSFRVEDPVGNGHINYDYSILADTPITYTPYYKENITISEENNTGKQLNNAIVAEIATSRLFVSNNPRLLISNIEETHNIVDINLPLLFSLTEMESHKDWSLQEYLDRQDEFIIMLFFDDNSNWMNSTIIINGWIVNNVIL